MQLDRKSFFMVTFLGIHPYRNYGVPNTICELGRKVVVRTFYWLWWAFLATLALTTFISGHYAFGLVLFTDTTLADLFPKDNVGYLAISLIITGVIYLLVFIALCGIALEEGKAAWYRKGYNHRVRDVFRGEPTPYKPSKTWQFISGLYKRFKDKTCVMIEYTNTER